MAVCSVEGCERSAIKRGWCGLHYQRWRKYGTTDGHGTPRGAATRFFNEVVLPYDGDECLIWPFANIKGYAQLVVDGKTKLVTRLVCEERHGPPPSDNYDAAHSCGNGHLGCVTKRHLDWKTRAENMADTFIHGTHLRGERSSAAKITEAQAREIKSLKGKFTATAIAGQFGISLAQTCRILRGERWGWLEPFIEEPEDDAEDIGPSPESLRRWHEGRVL